MDEVKTVRAFRIARCAASASTFVATMAAGQTVSVYNYAALTGTFDGGQGAGPEVVRVSDQHHVYYSTNGIPSTLPSPYTQPNSAGGGQTGGGLVDGAVRVAECSFKLGISYSNAGPYPIIELRELSRTYLAAGYAVVGYMSTPVSFSPGGQPLLDIAGTGPIPFTTRQTGTPGFFSAQLVPVTGAINGNSLMPGLYRLSATLGSPYMPSTTQPGEVTRDATFTIILGLAPCYANCDESSVAPLLNANDFQCFLNKFAAGDSNANCDESTAAPTLNANDFQCFLNKFAVGCS